MNLFVLDDDPEVAAKMACNSHVIAISRECMQMLANVLHAQGHAAPTKGITHVNHPVSVWVRSSKENYLWAFDYGMFLCDEYWYRYGRFKNHHIVNREKLMVCKRKLPKLSFDSVRQTKFAQAMPEEYKDDNPVIGYRRYYLGDKTHLFSWKQRVPPTWVRSKIDFDFSPCGARWTAKHEYVKPKRV